MPEHPRIEELRRRVQRDPASIAFAQLAEEHRRAGQLAEAVAVCRSGLAIHPGYLSARVTLARALSDLGQFTTARSEFETVLASAPDNLAALRGVAEVHHRQGSLAEALAFYRRAFALAPNDPDLERLIGDLAREVASTRPAADDGLLSLEQLAQELERQALGPAPAAPDASPDSRAPFHVQTPIPSAPPGGPIALSGHEPLADLQRERHLRKLAALEQWLAAIHGARPQPGA
jgi:tetratricopeptide (TPR) repeat protein